MTVRPLRLIRWAALIEIFILSCGMVLTGFVPGIRKLVVFPSSGTASVLAADTVTVPAGVPIGGPFKLTDHKGHTITDADYRGRWMLVFFGYTNCPDECPLTLQKMATALKDLGPLAEKIAPLFITVDPARDTPSRLASYLQNFDTRIVGLRGNDDQIAAVARAYRVYYSPGKNEQSGDDLISHSTFLYPMNPSGKLAALFPQEITADKLAAELRTRLSMQPDRNGKDTR